MVDKLTIVMKEVEDKITIVMKHHIDEQYVAIQGEGQQKVKCGQFYQVHANIEPIVMKELRGNDKRKVSCQKVGGDKKRLGHQRENDFMAKYNPNLDHHIEFGPTSDTCVSADHPIAKKLQESLGVTGFHCTNKSGKNIQLTLGRIPELVGEDNLEWLKVKQHCRSLFQKYLKKSCSAKPANLLVYKDLRVNHWIFFNVDDIIDFIVNHVIWRKLDSGRIKGDLPDLSGKGKSQYITYEYRTTHKSHFLGMNGNRGQPFIDLLIGNINFVEDEF